MTVMINVFDGYSGEFRYTKQFDEKKVIHELKNGNAVEIYDKESNNPISNVMSNLIKTDSDGFASLK